MASEKPNRVLADSIGVRPGDKFGQVTVLGHPFYMRADGGRRFAAAVCLCKCGSVFVPRINNLKRKLTMTCGCLRATAGRRSHHPLYGVWVGMKARCIVGAADSSPLYADRGIQVCREWVNDFSAFYEWALANGWRRGLQIDRIDNNGHYRPDNCRFVTPQDNSNNRRDNLFLTAFGERKTLSQWSRDVRCAVPLSALRARVVIFGWPIELALTKPSRGLGNKQQTEACHG